MPVIVDLEIPAHTFDLGRVTSVAAGVHLELERVVPSGREVMPFFWASEGDFEAFERQVREEDLVEDLTAVARFPDRVLYHVVWGDTVASLTRVLAASEVAVLEAHGDDPWEFRLRFADHESVQSFDDRCREAGIEVHVQRIYTLDEATGDTDDHGITPEQRTALVAVVREGYFEVPRRTTLDAVATDLDISQQALSERVRRGTDRVLRGVLLDGEE